MSLESFEVMVHGMKSDVDLPTTTPRCWWLLASLNREVRKKNSFSSLSLPLSLFRQFKTSWKTIFAIIQAMPWTFYALRTPRDPCVLSLNLLFSSFISLSLPLPLFFILSVSVIFIVQVIFAFFFFFLFTSLISFKCFSFSLFLSVLLSYVAFFFLVFLSLLPIYHLFCFS